MTSQPPEPEHQDAHSLPNSRESEESLVGSALINPEAYTDTMHIVSPSDFHIHRNGWIWEACKKLESQSEPIDFLTISEQLKQAGRLDEVGGPAYLTQLINSVPSALHAETYARIIKDRSQRRGWIEIANSIAKDGYGTDELDPAKYAQALMNNVSGQRSAELIDGDDIIAYIEMRMESPAAVWGIPTPWKDLNELTGGLHPGKSTLLKGKSGIGKTIFLNNLAFHAAREGHNVLMYELEMSMLDLKKREISIQTGITEYKIDWGKVTKHELKQLREAGAEFNNLTLWADDLPGWTSQQIRADVARKTAAGNKPDLVLVDYMGLMADKADTSHELIEFAAKGMRNAAKEFGFHAFSIVSETKAGTIKGTGEVRYNADNIWEFVKLEDKDKPQTRRIIFDKARHGGGGENANSILKAHVDLVLDLNYPVLRDATKGGAEEEQWFDK